MYLAIFGVDIWNISNSSRYMNTASRQNLLLNMPDLKFVCLVCKHSSHSSTSSQIYLAISFVRILQRRLSLNLRFSDGQTHQMIFIKWMFKSLQFHENWTHFLLACQVYSNNHRRATPAHDTLKDDHFKLFPVDVVSQMVKYCRAWSKITENLSKEMRKS